MTAASAIVLYPVLDQIGILAAVGQHDSVKLLEAELPRVVLVEAPVEQVNIIVGKIHEAKRLLQAVSQVSLTDGADPPLIEHLEGVHDVEVRLES